MMDIETCTRTHHFDSQFLQHTFLLLRQDHPSLALIVQNLIANTKLSMLPAHNKQTIPISLEAKTVSDIINGLSDIGDRACADTNRSEDQLIEIRTVLVEWLVYAQQFLSDDTAT